MFRRRVRFIMRLSTSVDRSIANRTLSRKAAMQFFSFKEEFRAPGFYCMRKNLRNGRFYCNLNYHPSFKVILGSRVKQTRSQYIQPSFVWISERFLFDNDVCTKHWWVYFFQGIPWPLITINSSEKIIASRKQRNRPLFPSFSLWFRRWV